MKKYLLINALILIILCVFFSGCTPEEDSSTVAIKSIRIHESSPDTFVLNEDLDLSEVKLVIEYKDGTSSILALSETMIEDTDRIKFNQISSSTTVVVNYRGRSCPFRFSVIESRQEVKYNVHFESNYGTPVDSQYVSVIEIFTLPTRPGWIFKGWYDNVDLQGDPVKAPYQISSSITFYAKWEDSRRYTVEFLDFYDEVIAAFTQTVIHGEDVELPGQGPYVEGYIFRRWIGSSTENITSNVQFKADYERIQCYVNFYFNYDSETPDKQPHRISYGDPFPINRIPQFVEKEGYNGNWYILNDDEEIEEIYNNQGVVITDRFNRITRDINVVPIYEIIKFKVTFQDDERFKNTGTSWTSIVKDVEYGSTFSLTAGDNADITYPAERRGHTTEWSVRIDSRWINIKNGSRWDEEAWEWLPVDPPLNTIEYKNMADDQVSAIIINQGMLITDIKSDITIQAKYVRNKYSLEFFRGANSLYVVEDINFGTKFCLYSPEGEPDEDITYGTMSKQDFVMYNSLIDWDIEWYPNAQFNPSELVPFEDGNYITIEENRRFFCDDIDKRVYFVEFYDWDFSSNSSVLLSILEYNGEEIEEISTQEVPHGADPTIPSVTSKLSYGYEFVDATNFWYDAPQDKGYAEQVYPSGITKSMKFYARYRIRTFSLIFRDYYYPYNTADDFKVIRDLPEVTYYKDEYGNDLPYGYVMMEAVYFRDFGHLFTDSEIYFGGDEIYSNKLFIEAYKDDENKYNAIDPIALQSEIDLYSGYINEIKQYEQALLNYTTTPESTARYQQLIGDYEMYRENLYQAEQLMNFYNDYKIQYYQEGDEIPNTGYREKQYNLLQYGIRDANGEFIKDGFGNYVYNIDGEGKFLENGDYDRFNNLFYQTTDRTGYVFDGWFTSPNFNANTKVSTYDEFNNIITEILVNNDHITFYAKWIDLEKGSDGLVFEMVEEYDVVEQEFIYYYKIIDYISQDQFNSEYTLIDKGGVPYYRNSDGSIEVRADLFSYNPLPSTEAELTGEIRLPSFHEGLPVRTVERTLFAINPFNIISVDIPKNIQGIEESVFSACSNLELFTLSADNTHFMLYKGVLYSADGSLLICYPAKNVIDEYPYHYQGNDITVPATTFIVPSSVERIAEGAFMNCALLRHIAFENGEESLEIGKKAFSGLTFLSAIGNILVEEDDIIISDTVIPNRLSRIEERAFENCYSLLHISATVNSQLIYVGESALTTTGWCLFTVNAANAQYVDNTSSGGIVMLGYVAICTATDFSGTQITLNNQVKAIADAAFFGKAFIEVSISDAMIYIGERAFSNCSGLQTVVILSDEPCQLGAGAFDRVSNYLSIYVPNTIGVVEEYKVAVGWSLYAHLIAAMPD